jgi:hypothetical protein
MTLTLPIVCAGEARSSEYRPKHIEDGGQICFERFEDNGAANIATVQVIVENAMELGMLGGQAICAYFPPGTYSIYLKWTSPYAGGQHRSAVSKLIEANVATAKVLAFEICRAAGRTDQWVLRAKDDRRSVKCDMEQ